MGVLTDDLISWREACQKAETRVKELEKENEILRKVDVPYSVQDALLDLVRKERVSQDEKWEEQDHVDLYWYAILGEEFGEVGRSLLEKESVDQNELIQVMAVALAWLENISSNEE